MLPTEDRTYEITVKFRVSGEVAEMVTEEHVAANIETEITESEKPFESAIGEIELWGEWYGNYDEVWALFPDGKEIEVSARDITDEVENETESELQIAAKDYEAELSTQAAMNNETSFTIYYDGGDTQILESSLLKDKNVYTFMGFGHGIQPYFQKMLNWVDVMLESKGFHLNRKTVSKFDQAVKKSDNSGWVKPNNIILPNNMTLSSDGNIYYHVQDSEIGRGWSVLMKLSPDKKEKEIICQDHRDNVRDYLLNEFVQKMGIDLEFVEVKNLDEIEI